MNSRGVPPPHPPPQMGQEIAKVLKHSYHHPVIGTQEVWGAEGFRCMGCCSEKRDERASGDGHTTGIGVRRGRQKAMATTPLPSWVQTTLRPPEGHLGELPKRGGSYLLHVSHAFPDLQGCLRSGVQIYWAGHPPKPPICPRRPIPSLALHMAWSIGVVETQKCPKIHLEICTKN